MQSQEKAMNEPGAETELSDLSTHDNEPLTPPLRSQEPFAIGSDGRFFINVNVIDPIRAASLAGRPLFVGAELTRDESRLALEVLQNAAHELRARIAGALWRPSAPMPAGEPTNEREAPTNVSDAGNDDSN